MQKLTVAISGMIANENPAPGIAVARSLKVHQDFDAQIVSLVYDALEAGTYLGHLADHSYLIPYPSVGSDDYFNRLLYIREHAGLDVLLPTLDAELLPVIKMEPRLKNLGVATFLPTEQQLKLRAKNCLYDLKKNHNLPIPRSIELYDEGSIGKLRAQFGFPVMVKGIFYEAYHAYNEQEVALYFQKIKAKWGLPIIIQETVIGEEYDVSALGDGKGNMIGAVAMRKMQLSHNGKAWAGVTVADEKIMELCQKVVSVLKWRGPMELELVKARIGDCYYILEINPRFPAWIYLAQGAGQNLPYTCFELALGKKPKPLPSYKSGVLFIRAAQDYVVPLSQLEAISIAGEWHNTNGHPLPQKIPS